MTVLTVPVFLLPQHVVSHFVKVYTTAPNPDAEFEPNIGTCIITVVLPFPRQRSSAPVFMRSARQRQRDTSAAGTFLVSHVMFEAHHSQLTLSGNKKNGTTNFQLCPSCLIMSAITGNPSTAMRRAAQFSQRLAVRTARLFQVNKNVEISRSSC